MGDLIFLFIVIVIVGSVIGKIRNTIKTQQDSESRADEAVERNRRILQAERMRRMQEEQSAGQVPYPVPHVKPHSPTVHPQNREAACDAHRPPVSSEGSPYRVHMHTSTETDCDIHSEPDSSEGESRQARQERIELQKAERVKHDAFLGRYDADDKRSIKEAHIRRPRYAKTRIVPNANAVLQGVIYSEILSPPISKRKRYTN